MKYIPGNPDGLKISLDRKVYGDSSKYELCKYGNIKLNLNNDIREVYLQWIAFVAHFELNVGLVNMFDVKFAKTAYMPTKSISCRIMRFKKPIYYNKVFRIIPNYTRYGISNNGVIIDTHTDKLIPHQKKAKGRYVKCTIYDAERGVYIERYVHRLVALAWVNNVDYVKNPQVNHIDGDKTNHDHTNLEWVSNKVNSDHAINNNLNPTKKYRCSVLDTFTNNVHEFNSLSKASKYMGVGRLTTSKLKKLVNQRDHKFKNRYKISSPNINYKAKCLKNIRQTVRSSIFVKDLSGVITKYKSVRQTSANTGDSREVISRDISEKRNNFSKRGYSYRLKDSDWDTSLNGVRGSIPKIIMMNDKDSKIRYFKSIRDASKKLKIDRKVIQRILRGGSTHINKHKHIKLSYM